MQYKCDGVQSARIATGSRECSPQGRDFSRNAVRKEETSAENAVHKEETSAENAVHKEETSAENAVHKEETSAENAVHKEETSADFRRTAVRFIFYLHFLFFRLQSSSTHAMEWNNVA